MVAPPRPRLSTCGTLSPVPPRFHVPLSLHAGADLDLPEAVARHVQVLRLQPGAVITVFHGEPDGPGGEFEATIRTAYPSDPTV